MRSRSPSRVSRRSPSFRTGPGEMRQSSRRGRSPDRRRRMVPAMSRPRSRDRREYRHSPRRRSRSPTRPKARSYSPTHPSSKRKMSPKRLRDESRDSRSPLPPRKRSSRSKSPSNSEVRDRLGSYHRGPPGPPSTHSYQGQVPPYPPPPGVDVEERPRGPATFGERFRESNLGCEDKPILRGPDEGVVIDPLELKKITIDLQWRPQPRSGSPIRRMIDNPDILNLARTPGEGRRPIFSRPELEKAFAERQKQAIEQRTVSLVGESSHAAGTSRFDSPGHFDDLPRGDPYYSGDARARSRSREPHYGRSNSRPKDYEHSSLNQSRYSDREKRGDDRGFARHDDDLRHELNFRRGDGRHYSGERRSYDRFHDYGDLDRSSNDLRMRINEKRTERQDIPRDIHRPTVERDDDMRGRMNERRGMYPEPSSDRRHEMDGGRMRDFGREPPSRIPPGGGGMPRRNEPGGSSRPPPEYSPRGPPQYKPWESNMKYPTRGRGGHYQVPSFDHLRAVPNVGMGRGISSNNERTTMGSLNRSPPGGRDRGNLIPVRDRGRMPFRGRGGRGRGRGGGFMNRGRGGRKGRGYM